MAYDPKDPADVAIVQGLIDTAVEEATAPLTASITRLETKRDELLGKLSKARTGDDNNANAAEVVRLETQIDEINAKLTDANLKVTRLERDVTKITTERDTANKAAETEGAYSRKMIVENGLTEALVAANVAPQFMAAAKAMLAKDVTVKTDGDTRNAVVGEKPLVDYVKEWADSDGGKHFVTAPSNGGAGAHNNNPANGGGTKKISEMTLPERQAHYAKVGADEFTKQDAAEKAAPKT